MTDTSTGDPGKPMKQSIDDLTRAMAQLSVTTDSSDKRYVSSQIRRTVPVSSQPKNLSDMPFDVVGLIIERSDYKEQLILRQVSKTLRALVDKQKPACKSIKVECCTNKVYITFNGHTVTYSKDLNNVRLNNNAETSVNIARDDFKKVAFDDLASTLKNPKLQLEEFKVVDYLNNKKSCEKYFNKLKSGLGSLNRQVSVKEIGASVRSSSWLLSILPHLKPGVLKKIWLNLLGNEADWSGESMNKIALLEQWKQVKELELWNCFERFPMKYATHFKRFLIRENVIDIDTFDRIKEFLSKLDNFEYCRITHPGRSNIDDVQRMTGIPVPPNMSHYSIPDSDYCLEFSFEAKSVTIVKKKCRLH